MKNEIFCECCNKQLEFVYVDGYSFGDRLMEGVMFSVKAIEGKPNCFGCRKEYELYMKQFNWDHWKKQCEDYCDDLDIATCPICGNDVVVEDEETVGNRPKPIAIGVQNAKDIIRLKE